MTTYNFKKRVTLGLVFAVFFLFFFILSSEHLLEYVVLTTTPKLQDPKLLILHFIANGLLFLSKLAIGITMLYIYNKLSSKKLPFVGFIWIYGIWFLVMSVVFAMNILSILRAYIWLDGMIRVLAGIFGIATCISVFRSIPYILNLKSPEEFGQLADEIHELREENKELQKILNMEHKQDKSDE